VYEVYFEAEGIGSKESQIRSTIEGIPGLFESEFEILELGKGW
jgi:hypothetical protein